MSAPGAATPQQLVMSDGDDLCEDGACVLTSVSDPP
jgi:hypothetical protein